MTKAVGTVLVKKDFSSYKQIDGNLHIAPVTDWDKEAKEIKLATITDNKVLTVKSTKATVSADGVITGKKAGKSTINY